MVLCPKNFPKVAIYHSALKSGSLRSYLDCFDLDKFEFFTFRSLFLQKCPYLRITSIFSWKTESGWGLKCFVDHLYGIIYNFLTFSIDLAIALLVLDLYIFCLLLSQKSWFLGHFGLRGRQQKPIGQKPIEQLPNLCTNFKITILR